MRLGELRIDSHRPLEVIDRLTRAVGGPRFLRTEAEQIKIVGAGVPSRRWCTAFAPLPRAAGAIDSITAAATSSCTANTSVIARS